MVKGKRDIRVRPAHFADADRIADIFFDSVHSIDSSIYSEAEQQAWAPAPVDYEYWRRAVPLHETFVACIDGQVVGFIGLEPEGYIDWLYTEKCCQGQGVAGVLYSHLERLARDRGLLGLSVSASDVARAFFERRGFRVLTANRVKRRGITLRNWRMQKQLAG